LPTRNQAKVAGGTAAVAVVGNMALRMVVEVAHAEEVISVPRTVARGSAYRTAARVMSFVTQPRALTLAAHSTAHGAMWVHVFVPRDRLSTAALR
jgi:hypothetical protein